MQAHKSGRLCDRQTPGCTFSEVSTHSNPHLQHMGMLVSRHAIAKSMCRALGGGFLTSSTIYSERYIWVSHSTYYELRWNWQQSSISATGLCRSELFHIRAICNLPIGKFCKRCENCRNSGEHNKRCMICNFTISRSSLGAEICMEIRHLDCCTRWWGRECVCCLLKRRDGNGWHFDALMGLSICRQLRSIT